MQLFLHSNYLVRYFLHNFPSNLFILEETEFFSSIQFSFYSMNIVLLILFAICINAELRLQHLQTTGTHNSYHIPSNPTTVHWNYTHPSLSYQLSFQNARLARDFFLLNNSRVFELDVGYNSTTGRFDVYHVPIYDSSTNCNSLLQCATNLRDWSLANSYHGPIFVQIEPKNPSAFTATVWNSYDAGSLFLHGNTYAVLNSVFARGHLLTPDMVRGTNPNLRYEPGSYVTRSDQILNVGWPTVTSSLGKIIFYTIGAYATYNSGIYSGLYNRTSFIAYDLKWVFLFEFSLKFSVTSIVQIVLCLLLMIQLLFLRIFL